MLMKAFWFRPGWSGGLNLSFAANEQDVDSPPRGAACAPGVISIVESSAAATNQTARSRFIRSPFLVDLPDGVVARVPRGHRETHPTAGPTSGVCARGGHG